MVKLNSLTIYKKKNVYQLLEMYTLKLDNFYKTSLQRG